MNETAATTLSPPSLEDPYVWEARDRYLADHDLGDGGYEDDSVNFKFGPVPVAFPNTPGRKREIRAHDVHHVVTGCNGIWNEGELDLVAFELRSGGCGAFLMGWGILLSLFSLGLILRPRQLFRTFVRARGSRNLFGTIVDDDVTSLRVGELRERLGWNAEDLQANGRDRIAFAGWVLLTLTLASLLVAALGLLAAWAL